MPVKLLCIFSIKTCNNQLLSEQVTTRCQEFLAERVVDYILDTGLPIWHGNIIGGSQYLLEMLHGRICDAANRYPH